MRDFSKKKCVLFIDPEAVWRFTPEINWLERVLHCEVITASDIVFASAQLYNRIKPFDLIILEMFMPDPEATLNDSLKETGLRFLRKYKKHIQETPVVVYTALCKFVHENLYEQVQKENIPWIHKDGTDCFRETVKDVLC